VKALLRHGADPNAHNSIGKTPLLLPIPGDERNEIYSLLIAGGGDINVRDMYGDTVLHMAVMSGADMPLFQKLITSGVDVNTHNKEGKTPLMLAVEHKNAQISAFLAANGGNIFTVDMDGKTPLEKALDAGTNYLSVLINQKNILQADSEGNTVLHTAVLHATPDSIAKLAFSPDTSDSTVKEVELLAQRGAVVNARNKQGDTPLSIAAVKNYQALGEVLLSSGDCTEVFWANGSNQSPLKIALSDPSGSRNWMLTAKMLDARDGNGNTALHYCAEWGFKGFRDAARLLVERGIDPNARNANGETALFKAVQSDDSEMIKYLAALGAAIDSRDVQGNTPLHIAARWRAAGAAKTLLALGADKDAQNLAGKTPLGIAVRGRDTPVMNSSSKGALVSILLDAGADINAADSTGRTILLDAVQSGSEDTVRMLLDRGASPLTQEMYGRTALHEAAAQGNLEMVTMLMQKGSNPLARDTMGDTPLSLAFDKGGAVIETLLGSSSNLIDSDGNTPLHIAVAHNAPLTMLARLLARDYPLNRRNSTGVTPLMLAVKMRNTDAAEQLLSRGADPYVLDNSGECAASLAMRDNWEILQKVMQYALLKTDLSGDCILHYAARITGRDKIYEILMKLLSADAPEEEFNKIKYNIAGEKPSAIADRWEKSAEADLLRSYGW